MEQLCFTPSAAVSVHNPHSSSSNPLEEAQGGEDSHSALAAAGNVSSKYFYTILLSHPVPLVPQCSGVTWNYSLLLHEYPEVQKKGTMVQVLIKMTHFLCEERA